jgi:hypothetical protein
MTAEEREENDITRKRENNMKEQSKVSVQKPSKQVGPLAVVGTFLYASRSFLNCEERKLVLLL